MLTQNQLIDTPFLARVPTMKFANILASGLSITLLCGLTACGGGGSKSGQTSTPTPTTPAAPTPPTPPPQPPASTYGAEFTISPTGDDTNPGTSAAPFKSLEKARDAVRAVIAKGMPSGGIAVWLRGGIYERSATLNLGAQDSGSSAANSVDWRAMPGETVRLIGGRKLNTSLFTPVTSSSLIWSRLDASAQGKVIQIDLKAQGITDFGTLKQRQYAGASSGSALELFIDAEPMTLARWPDLDVTETQDLNSQTYRIFGTSTPDAAGTYNKIGTEDGVPIYQRNQPVGGQSYYLYRYSWDNALGSREYNWYIATSRSGFPVQEPYWVGGMQLEPRSFTPSPAFPNAGALSALDPARVNHGFVYTASADGSRSFTYLGDRPSRWTQAKDPWADGFWYTDYADFHLPITSIDTASSTIILGGAAPIGTKANRNWCAYNLLEEITLPGEWYLDRITGILYLWPPDSFGSASDIVVSLLEENQPLVALNNTKHVRLLDLVLEATRGTLIQMDGAETKGVSLIGLTLRNSGAKAIHVAAGESCLISHCKISGMGTGAVTLIGGDRKNLTPSNHRMEDCEVHHFGRFVPSGMAGVFVNGCGATIKNNHFHHGPNSAIVYAGNDHLIEYNDIHDMCYLLNDAGAIYTGGGWGTRGTIIRNNFIHDIRSPFGGFVGGVYVDNTGAGTRVEKNVFYGIQGTAIIFGGGRDSVAINNVIAKCTVSLSASSQGRQFNLAQVQSAMTDLIPFGYQQEPWLSRYSTCADIPSDPNVIIAQPHWLAPEGSIFSRNISWQSRSYYMWGRVDAETYYQEILNNIMEADPLFVDEAVGNLNLKPNSPAFTIPGFTAIPFDQIGIRE